MSRGEILCFFLLFGKISLYLQHGVKKSEAKRVLGRQSAYATPWLTERHGYDPTLGK